MKAKAMPLILACLSFAATAAPPAGHPDPGTAQQMLRPARPARTADLPLSATVAGVQHAGEYTYIEASTPQGPQWLAAPRTELKVGQRIRYDEGAMMKNFHSKLLNRSFASVMFVDLVMAE